MIHLAILAFAGVAISGRQAPLVELFTSEGCSSCPPADKLLSELQSVNGVIALEEHVDYWNRLGWTDPFSSQQFSARQGDYSKQFGLNEVYTPQMVVNGMKQFIGSDEATARAALEEVSKKTPLAIETLFHDQVLEVSIKAPGQGCEVWLAATESGLATNVKSGENSGSRLEHTSVVRTLQRLATLSSHEGLAKTYPIKFNSAWQRKNVRLVVFAQAGASGKVLGASELVLN